MKVKRATYFYNTNLLNRICANECNSFSSGHLLGDSVEPGDIIKLIGEPISALVKVTYISPKDCNGNRSIGVKLVKVLPGELEIEYNIE